MSGTSAVAIDNKIEQAMVRNHRNSYLPLVTSKNDNNGLQSFFLGFS